MFTLCGYWAVCLINSVCWSGKEADSPICRTTFRSERAHTHRRCHQQISLTAVELSHRLISLYSCCLYSFSVLLLFSSSYILSLPAQAILSSALCYLPLSGFLLSAQMCPGHQHKKWDTCQSRKASGGRGRCLGRGSACYLISPEWCLSESESFVFLPTWLGRIAQSQRVNRVTLCPALSSANACLQLLLSCMGLMGVQTPARTPGKHTAVSAIDKVAMATVCPAGVPTPIRHRHTYIYAPKHKHLCLS